MTTFAGHLLGPDVHASRPAATAVPVGTLYSCSEHGLIYQSDGSAWSTYATLGGSSTGWTYFEEQTFANTTLASFTGIPAGLVALRIELEWTGPNSTGQYGRLRFNSDSGANYDFFRQQSGSTTSVTSQDGVNLTYSTHGTLSHNYHILDVSRRSGEPVHFVGTGRYTDPWHMFWINGTWQNTVDDIASVRLLSGTADSLISPRITVWGR